MSVSVPPQLVGRRGECGLLDDLLAALRDDRRSSVRVLRGEAGIGKSVLLNYLAGQAQGVTVARAQGVEADMELAYAGLQQLCGGFQSGIDDLPEPQRDALQVAFGMVDGNPPDRFLVGLAVLTLLTNASEQQPVLVIVDDAQWLDRVSLLTLEFVARRLLAEAVALVFAVRDPAGASALTGLAELRIDGLDTDAARELLDSTVGGRLEGRVRDRLVAETRGNPLALVELCRGRTAAELAYGVEVAESGSVTNRVEQDFVRRLCSLPADTRRLLLIAAAEPVGDSRLLVKATELLGVVPDAAPASAAGLIEMGESLRFRHPLARSAVYRQSDPEDRRAVHRALAQATDPVQDPDRRAWHSAQASDGPDEDVAAELERAADRARQRGGLSAEAVLLQRAAELSPDPWERGRRAVAAAGAHFSAAAPDRATELAALAELCPLSRLDQARLTRLRARILFARSRSDEAAPLLLTAATQFTSAGSPLARETYLEAISATVFAGRVHGPTGARAAAIAARGSGAGPSESVACDLLLDGAATLLTDGHDRGVPALRRALVPLLDEEPAGREETINWLLHLPIALESFIHYGWDLSAWDVLSARAVRLAREIGALSLLPTALIYAAGVQIHHGDFAAAGRMIEEADGIAVATGNAQHAYAALVLVGWRGEESAALGMVEQALANAAERGEVSLLGVTGYIQGVLYNGLAQYERAYQAARAGIEHDGYNFTGLSLVEHVEAAARCGDLDQARASSERLADLAGAAGSGWARGVSARSRALLTDTDEADRLYRIALQELEADRVMVEVARTHLLYGEWLRRVRRRAAAREQLRVAHRLFDGMGAAAFAERARRELSATGERVRVRTIGPLNTLTPQEAQIAALAADGMTNPKIGAELFLSPHTVEWHLRKVYSKLGISSRRQLPAALAGRTGQGSRTRA